MKKLSDEFIMSVGLLLVSFFIFQITIFPNIFSKTLTAAVSNSVPNDYNLKPSTKTPGVFTFNYKFATSKPTSEKSFDAAILPFQDSKAGGVQNLGRIRDAWNYPVRENAFQKPKTQGTLRSDNDPLVLGQVNCRATTSVTGYFKAYFEDVALDTNVGYDDPTLGTARRNEACQVLQDISILLKLDQTTVTPDILFMANASMPSGALAAATSYFGYYSVGPDNGALHKHIISHVDPTPGPGNFDALIMTGWSGVQWDVDSTLNPSTYDFYTVLYHEALHALGFRGLLPSVVTSTNDAHLHGTFDAFTYGNIGATNNFFDPITEFLQVPIGAPSPWFITNTVSYKGVKNIIGATPDGVRPVYSPASWQQGSSLSHFDMNRAPGTTYVMHPSIGTNTVRLIHNDEKEVLCHLGYEVLGMTGCEQATPFAQEDVSLLNGWVCLRPLINDISFGGALTIYSLTPIDIQSGDSMVYYSNSSCSGGTLPNASGAKSVWFVPTSDPSPRIMEYKNIDPVSNRISSSTEIKLVGCESDPDEYVCNGGFEMTYPGATFGEFDCGAAYSIGGLVPFWCQVIGTPDLYSHTSTNPFSDLPLDCGVYVYSGCMLDSPDGSNNIARFARRGAVDTMEGLSIELKNQLTPGIQYILSFDLLPQARHDSINDVTLLNSVSISAALNSTSEITYMLSPAFLPIFDQTILNQNVSFNVPGNQWTHIEQIFIPNDSYDFLEIHGDYEAGGAYEFVDFHVDNVSVKPYIPDENTIKGKVYNDQNSNALIDTSEPGLDGIQIGLFEAGNATPLETATTQNIPHLGEYEFTSLPDGTYYVGLIDESVFPNITQPGTLPGTVPGHTHLQPAVVSGGATDANNDFGVTLVGDVVSNADLHVKKLLTDSTLTTIDRNITFKVEVSNLGPNTATNIVMNDPIPSQLLYISHTTPAPNTYVSATGVWTIPSLPVGQTTYIEITMKVPNTTSVCGTKTNTASLVSFDQNDINPADNQASASIKLKACVTSAPSVK